MDYTLLRKDIYEEKLSDLLKRREDGANEGQKIYADPKGIPTVGIGYALLYANHKPRDIEQIKTDMKIALPSENYADIRWNKVEKLLGGIHKHLDRGHSTSSIIDEIKNYYKSEGNHALRLSTQDEKALLVNATLPQFEAALDKKLDKPLPFSEERMAVISQLYRLGVHGAPSLLKAINEGNRAEAWYEIRYNSNADNLKGNYSRVIEESDLFGLHDKYPNAKNESDIQHMFNTHSAKIAQEEKKSPLYEQSNHAHGYKDKHIGASLDATIIDRMMQEDLRDTMPLDTIVSANKTILENYPHLAMNQTDIHNGDYIPLSNASMSLLPPDIATPNENIADMALATASTVALASETPKTEPFNTTTQAQKHIDRLYPHLASSQTQSENTREAYQSEKNEYSDNLSEYSEIPNLRSTYDNGLPDSVNAYLDQFKPQEGYAYENDVGMDID